MTFGARFLRYPDLFPARPAGEPWGDASYLVNLPGGPYEVSNLSAAQFSAMVNRYGEHRETSRSGAISKKVQVFTAEASDFLPTQDSGWEYTIDLDGAATLIRIAAHNLMARIERGTLGGGSIWTYKSDAGEFIDVVENVLRPLVASNLLETGGLLVHSSGIVIDGRCFLFVGHSGAGKSTMAGLALDRGHKVLSDDLNVLVHDGEQWKSRRLPFAGSHQSDPDDSLFPVAGIVRLRQAPEHRIEPISAAEAFSLLYSAAPFVNTDPFLSETLEATVLRIVESLPQWSLGFRKDVGVWDIIESL